jgi:hypothetical protein
VHGDQLLRHQCGHFILVNEYQAPSAPATSEWTYGQRRDASQGEEPERVMGMPVGDVGPHASQGGEPQHVMGFSADSYGPGPAEGLIH